MGASLRDHRSHPSLTGSLHMATTDTPTVTDKTDKVHEALIYMEAGMMNLVILGMIVQSIILERVCQSVA